ncbi:hypothetical protein BDA96_02G062100 [Sorghum bicolor]|uniref:Uncharacterized protein n=1 Tax=Sorghum bicolor TaxID=4558 RepID=A0A921RLR2_SORBI|nr:hypothetical protein BDA96_02G062100 [Sorghum bicolor]
MSLFTAYGPSNQKFNEDVTTFLSKKEEEEEASTLFMLNLSFFPLSIRTKARTIFLGLK